MLNYKYREKEKRTDQTTKLVNAAYILVGCFLFHKISVFKILVSRLLISFKIHSRFFNSALQSSKVNSAYNCPVSRQVPGQIADRNRMDFILGFQLSIQGSVKNKEKTKRKYSAPFKSRLESALTVSNYYLLSSKKVVTRK